MTRTEAEVYRCRVKSEISRDFSLHFITVRWTGVFGSIESLLRTPIQYLNMENGTSDSSDPSSFLSEIIGAPVVVKLNSSVVYKGLLQNVDGYVVSCVL